jgi:hypothetical protein
MRFLESAFEENRESRPSWSKIGPSTPPHGDLGLEERQPCEDGPEGGRPRLARSRCGRNPRGTALALLAPTDCIECSDDSVGVGSLYLDAWEPAQTPI